MNLALYHYLNGIGVLFVYLPTSIIVEIYHVYQYNNRPYRVELVSSTVEVRDSISIYNILLSGVCFV